MLSADNIRFLVNPMKANLFFSALVLVMAGMTTACSDESDDGPPADILTDTLGDDGEANDSSKAEDDTSSTADIGTDTLLFDASDVGITDTFVDEAVFSDTPTDVDPELPQWEEPVAFIKFDLTSGVMDSPFPYDFYRVPETGLLRLDDTFTNSTLLDLELGPYPPLLKDVQAFATYAPILFLTSVAPDPATLPADSAASTLVDSSIQLRPLDSDGSLGDPVPVVATYEMYQQADIYHLVTVHPLTPLENDSRYVFIVTDALKDADGTPFGRSDGFQAILGRSSWPADGDPDLLEYARIESRRARPILESLPNLDHIIAAVDFTTGTSSDETYQLMERFFKDALLEKPIQIPYNLDPDGDLVENVQYGTEYEECSMAEGLGYGITGVFHPLNFTGPQGRFVYEDGDFKTFDPIDVVFDLMVPAGEGPFPVVIAQHGIDSNHHAMCGIARQLVEHKMAVLRWEWPLHGSRSVGGRDGLNFLSLTDPFAARDNFRQSISEISSGIILIDELSAKLDKWPQNAPDGVFELDNARIGYMGHSLGSIIGVSHYTFSDRIKVMVSNVGGLGLWHLVKHYINNMMGGLYTFLTYANVAEHMVWAGDGISFVDRVFSDPITPGHDGKYLLAQEVINDDTVPNSSTEALARTVGLPLLRPFVVPIDGVEEVDLTDSLKNVLVQVEGQTHESSLSSSSPLLEQALHYMVTGMTTGMPELVSLARPN